MNPFTDKYFTKARYVAYRSGMNPIVKYRVFGRFKGMAALEPAKFLIKLLAPSAKVEILPMGQVFDRGDTMMIVEGPFQELVELETMFLQWCALPCYCAYETDLIMYHAGTNHVMDFSARHMFGSESSALASYGAAVGGIQSHSTDVGASARNYLRFIAQEVYLRFIDGERDIFQESGEGTTPHALIAIFKGDYVAMATAYLRAYPNDKFVALIDYNNNEIDDTLLLFRTLGPKLWGVRIDTPGENFAQVRAGSMPMNNRSAGRGVTIDAVEGLRKALDENGGEKVRIIVSSGFDYNKICEFSSISESFDAIGTGSFVPRMALCTADIFEVDGEKECKIGREWGYNRNDEFYERL